MFDDVLDKLNDCELPVVVSMSGGKDSLAMALMMIERGERIDDFLYFDFGYDFPECVDTINRFEQETGNKVIRIKPKEDFWYWAVEHKIKIRGKSTKSDGSPKRTIGRGFPNIWRRWCTSKKIQTINKWKKQHYPQGCIDCVGICADEPKRIKNEPNKRYPLVDYKITEQVALQYCRERGYYKSPCAYDYINRMSCYVCPLQNQTSIKYLLKMRPELWAKIKELEQATGQLWQEYKGVGTDFYEQKFFCENFIPPHTQPNGETQDLTGRE